MKNLRLIGAQDQSHVANQCMQDIGAIPWVKTVLDTVAAVATETRKNKKLRARFVEAIVKYNNTVVPVASPRGTVCR